MATGTFDTLAFVQTLERVGVDRPVAEAHAELARDAILAETATKDDLDRLQERLEARMDALELRMTVKLGAMIAASVAIVVAAQRLFFGP